MKAAIAISGSGALMLATTVIALQRTLQEALLGGSWLVINGVVSRVTIVTTQIRGLIAIYNYP